MSKVDDTTRLRHMLEAAQEANEFSQGKTRQDLDSDRILSLALVRLLEIIGEAASKVSQERQKQIPEIPWRKMIGMRNRIVHAYFEIDLDILWDTITYDLHELIPILKKYLTN